MKVLFVIAVCLLLMAQKCDPDQPQWHGELYAGSSAEVGIRRQQSETFIHCSDEKFDNYVCTSYQDLSELIEIIDSCKKW